MKESTAANHINVMKNLKQRVTATTFFYSYVLSSSTSIDVFINKHLACFISDKLYYYVHSQLLSTEHFQIKICRSVAMVYKVKNKSAGNWILTSCQPHRVTSRQSNSSQAAHFETLLIYKHFLKSIHVVSRFGLVVRC